MLGSEVNVKVSGSEEGVNDPGAALDRRSVTTPAVKGNAALLAAVSAVSLVKGGAGLMVGRSISVDWLSTLFPLVTFLAKYRHFHN